MKIEIEKLEDVDTILVGLSKLPYYQVFELIDNIRSQIHAQLEQKNPQPTTAPPRMSPTVDTETVPIQ